MSFEDLEWGRTRPGQSPLALATKRREEDDSSQAVAAGVFRINTAVSAFYRLVNSLGTPKDTLELREKLHKTRLHIGQLVKDTSAKLKQASENDQHTEVSFSKKVADANLVALPSRSCLHHFTSLLSRKLLYLSCSMNSFWQARGLSMLSWIACLIAVFCYRNLISLFFRGFLFLSYKYAVLLMIRGCASKRIADAKLAKDFQAVLKEFQKAQRLAVERETAYTPFVPKEVLPSSYDARELEISSGKNLEQQAVLLESRRQEVVLLDNEITFNEAIIEEREQGIQEIQQQIGEVNEIFKDLAVLVHGQGTMIDDISSNIEKSHAATGQASTQLEKASKLQKSNSSLVTSTFHSLSCRIPHPYLISKDENIHNILDELFAAGDFRGNSDHCGHSCGSMSRAELSRAVNLKGMISINFQGGISLNKEALPLNVQSLVPFYKGLFYTISLYMIMIMAISINLKFFSSPYLSLLN
ncbi:Syntaxin-22 [Vitis vinifera]|uniref:Syntaxin-22 n=1 Tax=Vitis vinifera TaxID=29760 RepID=A0A438G3L0_VITVI|nr:Syntaxin-22 [Vitis vinifera]